MLDRVVDDLLLMRGRGAQQLSEAGHDGELLPPRVRASGARRKMEENSKVRMYLRIPDFKLSYMHGGVAVDRPARDYYCR